MSKNHLDVNSFAFYFAGLTITIACFSAFLVTKTFDTSRKVKKQKISKNESTEMPAKSPKTPPAQLKKSMTVNLSFRRIGLKSSTPNLNERCVKLSNLEDSAFKCHFIIFLPSLTHSCTRNFDCSIAMLQLTKLHGGKHLQEIRSSVGSKTLIALVSQYLSLLPHTEELRPRTISNGMQLQSSIVSA